MDPVSIGLMFLKKWWKEILIVLVVVAGIWYVRNLQNTVEEQKVTITQMKMANDTLKESNRVLTNTVTANNKTIEELSKGADKTKQEFDKLNSKVAQQTTELTRRLKDILNRPAPVTCEDTIDYLLEAVPTYKSLGEITK